MGARSIVVYESQPEICVYFHWIDQIDQIRKIVESAKIAARSPGSDPSYSLAAFIHVATNMVYASQKGEKLSIGVGLTADFDEKTFVIGPNWEVCELN